MSQRWRILSRGGGCVRVGTGESRVVAVFGGLGDREALKDAVRAVELVNAFAGMDLNDVRRVRNILARVNRKRVAR